jgi:hypothetical protein
VLSFEIVVNYRNPFCKFFNRHLPFSKIARLATRAGVIGRVALLGVSSVNAVVDVH